MRIYKRTVEGMSLKVWNDSGVDWVIQDDERIVNYPIRTMTMTRAITLHVNIFGGK